jgi:hypothetical protein
MRRNVWAAAAVICLAAGAARGADDVGPLGDPAKLTFEGTLPASPDRLRWALGGDPSIQAAAEPDQPLADYLATLERRLRAGLRSSGYARPAVAVDAAADKVVVRFDIGARRRQGRVMVDGDTAGLNAPDLIRRLTTPTDRGPFDCAFDAGTWTIRPTRGATDPKAVWSSDGWADFDNDGTGADHTTSVADALADMGYLAPRVATAVEDDGTAGLLHVHARELGPQATVDKVVVTGVKSNPPAAIADLLGLHVGQRLDLRQLQDAQQRLWDSGRLVRHTITASQADDGSGRAVVAVDVFEGDLPPISKPFTPTEQAMLRLRTWLAAGLAHGRDVTFDFATSNGTTASLAAGGRSGVTCTLRARWPQPGGRTAGLGCDAVFTAKTIIVILPDLRQQWTLRLGDGQIVTRLAAEANLGVDADQKPWTASANAQASFSGNVGGPPVRLDVALAPAFFVHQAHLSGWSYDVRDGVLAAASGDPHEPWRLRVKLDTGELLSFGQRGPDSSMTVAMADEAVATRAAAIAAAAHGEPNAADASSPIPAAASLIVQELARAGMLRDGADDAHADRATAVVARLASPANLAPIQWPAAASGGPDDFDLPAGPADPSAQGQLLGAIANGVLAFDDHLFARDTWPWHLQRSAGMTLANQAAAADTEAAAVDATGGPIACLAAAEVQARLGQTDLAATSARHGLDRLTNAAFDRDVRGLLADGCGTAAATRRVVDAARQLTPAEVDDLAGGLPPAAAARLRTTVLALRVLSPEPGERAVGDLLDRAWGLGLRDRVAAELRRLTAVAAATQP